ncbi:MAG: Rpn family recombination-promoting nuclease/putative transposase [Aureispira sp.]
MDKNPKFISLLSDYGFKIAFADESNTLFLRRALQALIQSKSPIKKVKFLRNEFVGSTTQSRGGVFDLICEDELKRTFIVEMQLGYYKHFIQRAKFYAFQKFETLIEKGPFKFDNLTPIYCIGFLAKEIFPLSNEYYHFGRLKNQKGEELDDQITHIIVEISKFKKEEEEIQSDLDKLIYIMKHSGKIKGLDELPEFLTEDWIEQAMTKIDESKLSPDQRCNYRMMLAKNGSIIEMMQEEKRQMRAELIEEVKAKITEEVKAKVKAEIAEKVINQAKRNMAKSLKEAGVDYAIISNTTGLTVEEIEQL